MSRFAIFVPLGILLIVVRIDTTKEFGTTRTLVNYATGNILVTS